MKVFGMVSTAASTTYTPEALASFFRHTAISSDDRFLLFDNDGALPDEIARNFQRLEVQRNVTPRSFAANVNAALRQAEQSSADLYFLNNDLIFTSGWLEPLEGGPEGILSPCSNREFPYLRELFRAERVLELSHYLEHGEQLELIAQAHRARHSGYRKVLTLPFFCVKLPYAVYSKVGDLDENFGKGGAEDNDYTLRAYLEGFSVHYALASYVLHFNGRSTWNGAEAEEESRERERQYLDVFRAKWGDELLQLAIMGKSAVLAANPQSLTAARTGDFRGVITALRGDTST